MKIRIPSFRVQIVLLVLFLVINSVLFFRNYFLDSFQAYSTAVESLELNERVNHLYQTYQPKLSMEDKVQFRKDIEEILGSERQKNLARRIFKNEITLYSKFIFVFLTLTVLVIFFISFNLITRPLSRLQSATEDLSKGNWAVQVEESKFSPLNDLIVSFNSMIKELKESRNRLIQAEKEMAWREMARVLAHEIKNPLTPIRLSLERLEDKYRSKSSEINKVMSRAISVIHEEIDNLQSLASEFSQFARLPKASFSRYDLNEQLHEIIDPYKDECEFHLSLVDNLPLISADRAQMKQAFVNLIQNGIQSSGNHAYISISTLSSDDKIVVTIKDKGVGIREEDVEKIFDPYFTKREKGTGLGLAIVKRIVGHHKGEIKVESELGKGTLITMSFPISPNNE